MLHTFDHSESCSPASNDNFRFLQEAPDFQEEPSTRLCPYHRFALSLRPKSISAAKSGRSIGTGASRTFAGHRDS